MISASDAKADVLSCLAAGLHGFVSKLEPDDEIVAAVNHVLSGGIYVPRWLAQVDVISSPPFGPGLPPALSDQAPLAKLTPRQRDVLPLLAQGMSNKEIARALKIAEATTKIHVAAVRRVLDVRNRTEAALAGRTLLDEQNVGGGSHRTGSRQGGSVSRMDPVADHVGLAAAGSANG
jgi:DNA-binding NarL/FixJ family response regulator